MYRPAELLDIPVPKGIQVEFTPTGTKITRRWFHWYAPLLGLFALLWLTIGLSVSVSRAPWGVTAAILVPGLLLGYYVFALFVNVTEVNVDRLELTIQHGPLPTLARNKTVPIQVVREVYFEKRYYERRDRGGSTTWELYMTTAGGKRERLIADMYHKEHASYLAQALGRVLGVSSMNAQANGRQ